MSRDGVHWERPFAGKFFLRRGRKGAWDEKRILPVLPLIHKEKIWIYFAGGNLPDHGTEFLAKANASWVENGQRVQRAIGLATLRLDGFVSLEAGKEQGILTTKILDVGGDALWVNADVEGDPRAEVLDEDGLPMVGYGVGNCMPVRGDSLQHRVHWKNHSGLEELRGKTVRLRFWLHKGHLYSFWFE